MIIKKIEIRNFRNYREEIIEFDDRINLITGENGQGKTNLIEAINLLSMGKSFRTRREQEMIREGTSGFSVKGFFEKEGRTHTVEVRFFEAERRWKKTYLVGGAEKSSVYDLLGGVYTIVFSPEDLSIVKGSPDARRRFLDREIILLRPLYYHKLKKYKEILKSRNALLKKEEVEPALLSVYDEQLAKAGGELMNLRAAYVKELEKNSAACAASITDGKETLRISYRASILSEEKNQEIEADKDTPDASAYERLFYEKLERARPRDLLARITEYGPHRDDLSIAVNGKHLRIYGSQGQQRTAALALRLAEREMILRETGETAILLLDDVMSELDPSRQEKVLSGFSENQVFITAAEWSGGGEITGKTIKIEDGAQKI